MFLDATWSNHDSKNGKTCTISCRSHFLNVVVLNYLNYINNSNFYNFVVIFFFQFFYFGEIHCDAIRFSNFIILHRTSTLFEPCSPLLIICFTLCDAFQSKLAGAESLRRDIILSFATLCQLIKSVQRR